jgi:hypothetical protein
MKNLHDAPAGVKVVRINITPVLTRGEQWCRKR